MAHSLLTLPRELRDRVYENVLFCETVRPYEYRYRVQIKGNDSKDGDQHKPKEIWVKGQENLLSIALLRTCKQLRDEGMETFYSKTDFTFRHATHMENFVSNVPDEYLDKIRKIVLDLGIRPIYVHTVVPRTFQREAGLYRGWHEDKMDEAEKIVSMKEALVTMVVMAADRKGLRELILDFVPEWVTIDSHSREDATFADATDLLFGGKGLKGSMTRTKLNEHEELGKLLTFLCLPLKSKGKRVQRMAEYGWKFRMIRWKESCFTVIGKHTL